MHVNMIISEIAIKIIKYNVNIALRGIVPVLFTRRSHLSL